MRVSATEILSHFTKHLCSCCRQRDLNIWEAEKNVRDRFAAFQLRRHTTKFLRIKIPFLFEENRKNEKEIMLIERYDVLWHTQQPHVETQRHNGKTIVILNDSVERLWSFEVDVLWGLLLWGSQNIYSLWKKLVCESFGRIWEIKMSNLHEKCGVRLLGRRVECQNDNGTLSIQFCSKSFRIDISKIFRGIYKDWINTFHSRDYETFWHEKFIESFSSGT